MGSSKKEVLARVGIATKGIIYMLLGGITAFAAFNSRQNLTASNDTLKYIASQSFGQILLLLTIIGIAGYVFWRLYLTINNPDNKAGNDSKDIVKRIGYALSALSYTLLCYTGIELLLNNSQSGSSKQGWIATILQQPWGSIVVYFIALILLGKAVYELYRAYSGTFKKRIQNSELNQSSQSFLIKAGKAGFTARAIVFGIIAFLFYKAASQSNAQMAGGTKQAFSFLQDKGGLILLGVVALGLMLYGIYLIASSRYRNIPID